MKFKKMFGIILPAMALILELLPNGVVLWFGNPQGKDWDRYFSYFDLTPFGYANFGPLLTGVLTCVLIVLGMIGLRKDGRGVRRAVLAVSAAALGTSLMPLLFGLRYMTWIGFFVSALLASQLTICIYVRN